MTIIFVFSICACGSNEAEEGSSSMPELSAVESSTPTPPPPSDVKVVISGRGVNVRTAPNTDCEVLGNVTSEPFYLVEEDDGSGFHKILYKGEEAYIYSEYCEIEVMTEAEAKALIEGDEATTESQEETNSEDVSESDPTVSVNSEDGQRR